MHRQTDKEGKEKSNPSASAVISSFVQCAVVSSSTHYCNHQPSGISHGERGDGREKGRTGDRYRQKEMFSIKSHNPTKYFLLTKYTGSGQCRHSFYSLNGSHH